MIKTYVTNLNGKRLKIKKNKSINMDFFTTKFKDWNPGV